MDWSRHSVECHWCRASLLRRLYRPKDLKRIERFFCGTVCKGEWQKTQKPVTKEWLMDEYVNKRRDAADIGKELGRDPKRVLEWLWGYGMGILYLTYQGAAPTLAGSEVRHV